MVKHSPLRLRPERGFLRLQGESKNSRKNRINGQEGRRIEPEGNFTVEKKEPTKGRKIAHTGPEAGTTPQGKSISKIDKSRSLFFTKCSHGLLRASRYTYTPWWKTPAKSSKSQLRAICINNDYRKIFLEILKKTLDFTRW